MTKKDNGLEIDDAKVEPISYSTPSALKKEEKPAEPIEEKKLYKPVKWKGILDTFYCEACGLCEPDEGDMILHVTRHVPEAERENLLNKLLSNKENK